MPDSFDKCISSTLTRHENFLHVSDPPVHVPYFLSNFEFYWYYYYDVNTSIYYAEQATPDLRYGWEDGLDLNLYGYSGIYVNGYNYQSDWSN
jgi:hypothetical protein